MAELKSYFGRNLDNVGSDGVLNFSNPLNLLFTKYYYLLLFLLNIIRYSIVGESF